MESMSGTPSPALHRWPGRRRAVGPGLGAALLLMLSSCGVLGEAQDAADEAEEALGELEEALEDQTDQGGGADSEDDAAGQETADDPDEEPDETPGEPGAIPIDEQDLEETVFHSGLEYSLQALTVEDLDEDPADRVLGVEVVVDVEAFNPGQETAAANPPTGLRWHEGGAETVVEIGGSSEFRQVPGGASASGELRFRISPTDLETYDADSAVILLGTGGQSAAQVPLGSQEELIDRMPVPQTDLVGEVFDHGEVEITVREADLRYDYGSSHVSDGQVLLEIQVETANETGGQVCWSRGTGNNFSVVTASGAGYVDEGMSDRGCVSSGGSDLSWTGFLLDEDELDEGELTVTNTFSSLDSDQDISFQPELGPGVPPSERDAD
ncbi:hypothetical protein [Nesterenkonia suensis]